MNAFTKDIAFYVSPRYVDVLGIVRRYVDTALSPWETDGATVMISTNDSLYNRHEIVIEIKLLPQLPFVYGIDFIPWQGEEDLAHDVGKKAFEFYRNRPALPVDDHIILGED